MDRIRRERYRYTNICTENGNFEDQVKQSTLAEAKASQEERSTAENRKKHDWKFYEEAISLTPMRITVICVKVLRPKIQNRMNSIL